MRDIIDSVSAQTEEIVKTIRGATARLAMTEHVAKCADHYVEMVEKHGMTNGTTVMALKLLKDSVAEWREKASN